jgi:hypothetical protein
MPSILLMCWPTRIPCRLPRRKARAASISIISPKGRE